MDPRPVVHVLSATAFPQLAPAGDHPALICSDGSASFTELEKAATELVPAIRALPEGIVVLEARATLASVTVVLAVLRSGRTLALLPADATAAEDAARRRLLGRSVEVDNAGNAAAELHQPGIATHPETALVLFTSGSTGGPRAVQLSRRGIRATVETLVELLAFERAAEQTLFLPISYSFGLIGQLLPAFAAGVTTRLLSGVGEARLVLEDGAAAGMWSGVPAQWSALLDLTGVGADDPAPLTHVVSAGDHLSPALRRRLHAAFPDATIYSNYGQTEAGPRLLCLSSDHPGFYQGGDGFPVGDFDIRVGPDGELCARGTPLMLGYLGDDSATAAKIRDGWLLTGDLAEVDDAGLVTVAGRKNDLVNVGGERTSLREIEAALEQIDGVADAAVLALPDESYGTRLIGLLVARDRALLTRRAINERLSDALSWHKIPRRYFSVAALPRSGQGKLLRTELAPPGEDADEIT